MRAVSSPWRAALDVEGLKLRRSTAGLTSALAVVLGVPGIATAFVTAARIAPESQIALKVAPMLVGTGWAAHLAMVEQMLSVAMLLAAGVVTAWCFGREHTDGTFGALFALPTRRRDVALTKSVVLVVWGVVVCATTLAVAILLGLLTGLGVPDTDAVVGAGRVLTVGFLTTLLALPFAFAAGALRGYLPGIGVLLGTVVATQVATIAGAGAWFPWAAPGMWAGLGGPAVAAGVEPVHLLLAVPVAIVATLATSWWWERAEVV